MALNSIQYSQGILYGGHYVALSGSLAVYGQFSSSDATFMCIVFHADLNGLQLLKMLRLKRLIYLVFFIIIVKIVSHLQPDILVVNSIHNNSSEFLDDSQHQKYAICTMVTNVAYIPAIQVNSYAISEWLPQNIDLVAIVMKEANLNYAALTGLQQANWTVKFHDGIKPPHDGSKQHKYAYYEDVFLKLIAWNLTEYKRVLFIDADILIVKDMTDLLNTDVKFGAVRDWGCQPAGICSRFNVGLMLVEPNGKTFQKFMALIKNDSVEYDSEFPEQSWLNSVLKSEFFELNILDNVHTSLFYANQNIWNTFKPYARAFHFIVQKPFLEIVEMPYVYEDPQQRNPIFADYDGINGLFYEYHDRMISSWGTKFTLVVFVSCQSKHLYGEYILSFPTVTVTTCNSTKLDSYINNSLIVPVHPHCDVNSKQKPKEICMVKYIVESNPFMSQIFYWINSPLSNSLSLNILLRYLDKSHSHIAGIKQKPWPVDVLVAVVEHKMGNYYQSLNILVVGGTRNSMQQLHTCRKRWPDEQGIHNLSLIELDGCMADKSLPNFYVFHLNHNSIMILNRNDKCILSLKQFCTIL